jgi:hypothetical protein
MNRNVVCWLAALSVLGGCASVTIPPDRLQSDQSTIRAAEELGAENVPEAKLHLQLAKDETASAQKLAADGNDRALLMLARADSDADLALSMARETAMKSQAAAAEADFQAVQARGTPASSAPSNP